MRNRLGWRYIYALYFKKGIGSISNPIEYYTHSKAKYFYVVDVIYSKSSLRYILYDYTKKGDNTFWYVDIVLQYGKYNEPIYFIQKGDFIFAKSRGDVNTYKRWGVQRGPDYTFILEYYHGPGCKILSSIHGRTIIEKISDSTLYIYDSQTDIKHFVVSTILKDFEIDKYVVDVETISPVKKELIIYTHLTENNNLPFKVHYIVNTADGKRYNNFGQCIDDGTGFYKKSLYTPKWDFKIY